ncbi:MAG TPA: polyhydroxyalkanoic acid system family protein [Thermomicrobiales bacterium]|nr:polyhydroxyalkanoic acid system family protein [Thermomicrobiales bacterium]
MPKTSIAIDHQLGQEEALSRLKGMLAQVKENYGSQVSDLQENWHDNGGDFSFKAMGFKISGDLAVTDSKVMIDAEFPWAAKPFQGTIEATIRERAERLLS